MELKLNNKTTDTLEEKGVRDRPQNSARLLPVFYIIIIIVVRNEITELQELFAFLLVNA